jgi:hypothetical protein
MILNSFRRPLRGWGVLSALVAAACLEPRHAVPADVIVLHRDIVAALALSDSAPSIGAMVTVTVQLQLLGGQGAPPRVASYTARLSYDTVALRFVGATPIEDKTTRVINATPHLVRAAGFAVDGIAPAALFCLTFQTRDARAGAALSALDLAFTELHSIQHDDLRLRLTPKVGMPRSAP